MSQNVKRILNIQELASYLNCSVSMIRKMIYRKEIPFFKIRKSLRIRFVGNPQMDSESI